MSRAGTGISEDARLELAMAAASRERWSRPRGLVVLAGLVLVGALVAAGSGLMSRASARSTAEARARDRVRVEQLLAELQKLDEQRALQGNEQAGQRIPDILSRVERLATEGGIKEKLQAPREGTERRPSGNVELTYTYDNVRDANLGAILEWMSLVVSRVPGTEVTSVKLNADQTQWTARVVFRRVERRS